MKWEKASVHNDTVIHQHQQREWADTVRRQWISSGINYIPYARLTDDISDQRHTLCILSIALFVFEFTRNGLLLFIFFFFTFPFFSLLFFSFRTSTCCCCNNSSGSNQNFWTATFSTFARFLAVFVPISSYILQIDETEMIWFAFCVSRHTILLFDSLMHTRACTTETTEKNERMSSTRICDEYIPKILMSLSCVVCSTYFTGI